jgi:hypothetical protein
MRAKSVQHVPALFSLPDHGEAMPDLKELQTKLADARQEVRNLTVMGMRDDLTPEKRATIRNLELSARAEAKLRQDALDHAKQRGGG